MNVSLVEISDQEFAEAILLLPKPPTACDQVEYAVRYHVLPHGLDNGKFGYEIIKKFTPFEGQREYAVTGLFFSEKYKLEMKILCERGFHRYVGTITTPRKSEWT